MYIVNIFIFSNKGIIITGCYFYSVKVISRQWIILFPYIVIERFLF